MNCLDYHIVTLTAIDPKGIVRSKTLKPNTFIKQVMNNYYRSYKMTKVKINPKKNIIDDYKLNSLLKTRSIEIKDKIIRSLLNKGIYKTAFKTITLKEVLKDDIRCNKFLYISDTDDFMLTLRILREFKYTPLNILSFRINFETGNYNFLKKKAPRKYNKNKNKIIQTEPEIVINNKHTKINLLNVVDISEVKSALGLD